MDWVKDLWRATLRYWWALMSCAVSNIVGVFALAFHKDNPWLIRSSFVLAGAFVVIAIALAWRDEHSRLLVEIAKNSKPNFEVEVSEFVRNTGETSSGTTYLARVAVVNTIDSPSTLRSVYMKTPVQKGNFRASKFGSAHLLRHKPTPIPTVVGEQVLSAERPVREVVKDVLPILNTEALCRGVHREGWVTFLEVPFETSDQEFTFYVEDGYGDPHGPFLLNIETEVGHVSTWKQN
jgi:hypothetical protein